MINGTIVNIGKNLVKGKVLGKVGGIILGRSAGLVSLGIGAYSSIKTYKSFMKKDDTGEKLSGLEEELNKWRNAINLIGREEYTVGDIKELKNYSGAINDLGKKELFYLGERYGSLMNENYNMIYHAPFDCMIGSTPLRLLAQQAKDYDSSDQFVDPNPKIAIENIESSIRFIESTSDNIGIDNFDEIRNYATDRLKEIESGIDPNFIPGTSYSEVQSELFRIVESQMIPIEEQYVSNLVPLKTERNHNRLKYGSIAVGTLLLGTLPFKKKV